jgi:hypothetical protein
MEQEPHVNEPYQQTSDMQYLKSMMKSLFEKMRTIKFLQLALWNVNGLTQHIEELKTFISIYNIGIMLISETHFTETSCLKLPDYTVYHSNHPAVIARGVTAIRIKRNLSSINTQTNLDLGMQLWGTASTSKVEILERFHSKALLVIEDAPWYVLNTVI